MSYFCPFVQDECRTDCIFYGGYFDDNDKDNCELYDGINTIRSLSAPDSYLDKKLNEIKSKLTDIECNTSSDQTESSSINDTLEEIKNLLKK